MKHLNLSQELHCLVKMKILLALHHCDVLCLLCLIGITVSTKHAKIVNLIIKFKFSLLAEIRQYDWWEPKKVTLHLKMPWNRDEMEVVNDWSFIFLLWWCRPGDFKPVLEDPLPCTFCMSPSSNTPDSTHQLIVETARTKLGVSD